MLYVYKKRNRFFKFGYLHDSVIETMTKQGDWFITDPTIVSQIEKIPELMERFIHIENPDPSSPANETTNIITIKQDYVKDEVLRILKDYRAKSLDSLDVLFNKAQESYFVATNDADKQAAQASIIDITNRKNQWRNIDQHSMLNPMRVINTIQELHNLVKEIRTDIKDPTYVPFDYTQPWVEIKGIDANGQPIIINHPGTANT